MLYRSQAHVLRSYPPFVMMPTGRSFVNSTRGSEWDNDNQGMEPGGLILPLIAGGITGALIAGAWGHKQAYAAEPYPVQGYPTQAYPAQPYPTPVPYYQPVPVQSPMMASQPQVYPTQAQVVNQASATQLQGYPSMPSIQGMPNDIPIQKQGQAYVTHTGMPSNQVTNSMPYYMFPMRFR